jgi:hypothetical protein
MKFKFFSENIWDDIYYERNLKAGFYNDITILPRNITFNKKDNQYPNRNFKLSSLDEIIYVFSQKEIQSTKSALERTQEFTSSLAYKQEQDIKYLIYQVLGLPIDHKTNFDKNLTLTFNQDAYTDFFDKSHGLIMPQDINSKIKKILNSHTS